MVGRKEDLEEAYKKIQHIYNMLTTIQEDVDDEAQRLEDGSIHMRWDKDDARWYADRLEDLRIEAAEVRNFLKKGEQQ